MKQRVVSVGKRQQYTEDSTRQWRSISELPDKTSESPALVEALRNPHRRDTSQSKAKQTVQATILNCNGQGVRS